MSGLVMRVYNVLFGDAILLLIPDVDEADAPVVRSVLIDCGNALTGRAGDDSVFAPVLADIRDTLGGAPVDLYVMTHEHMDHIQGLLYGSRALGIDIRARQVWLTASAAPDYYERFTGAARKRRLALAQLDGAARLLAAAGPEAAPELAEFLAINNPRASKDCVDHLRGIGEGEPAYVHRTADIAGRHPFRRTRLAILGPEEDTSIYYGPVKPLAVGDMAGAAPLTPDGWPTPPPGVAAGHFFDLLQFRASGLFDNRLAIDRAANNSSVVIEIEWEGWRILLPGDAEEKSWALMAKHGLLRPAHVVKVSHHGSVNGSPPELFEHVLPETAPDGRPRYALLSTANGAYPGVPNDDTLAALAARATLTDTRAIAPGAFAEIVLPAEGTATAQPAGRKRPRPRHAVRERADRRSRRPA